jgi:hypothetical protein
LRPSARAAWARFIEPAIRASAATSHGSLPLDTALNYARQIAGALEAAHGRFLIPVLAGQAATVPMTVVINWTAGLKK